MATVPSADVLDDAEGLSAARVTDAASPALTVDDKPQDAYTSAQQSERDGRAQAVKAAFVQDVATSGIDETAATDSASAAASNDAQTSRTLDDSASGNNTAIAAEPQKAERGSRITVDDTDGEMEDPCLVTAAGPLEQGLLMTQHITTEEAAPVISDFGSQPLSEPTSPPGRTSASDLIAAMVRQAEEQEAAARKVLDVAAGVDSATAAEHAEASPPEELHPDAVWTDVGLDEDSTMGETQPEQQTRPQSAQEQSTAGIISDD
jgi:hypothetical protein